MEHWRPVRLGEVVELQRGYDLPEYSRRSGSVPVIGSAGITGYHDTAKVDGPGVTLGRAGASFGKVTFVHEPFWPHNATLFVKDFKGNDVTFVRYLLESIDFSSINSGAAQPMLNRNYAYLVPVKRPPFLVQRRVAGILSAYDDLIENCERRIRVLDEMARALYREWFVLFRYPGHEKEPLVDSPLGTIPKGWGHRLAKDLAAVTYGYPFASALFSTDSAGLPVVRIRDIIDGASRTFTTESAESRYLIKNGDVLVGMDGYFHMCIWWNGTALQNQRVARFRPSLTWAALHFYLALEPSIKVLNKAIVGTTVAHLGDMHIKNIALLVPNERMLALARDTFQSLGDEMSSLRSRCGVLRKTRDLLLPRLLSGQLSLEDAA